MSESLGDSVLYLRTDDSKYNSGLDNAHKGAQKLDSTFQKTGRGFFDIASKISMIYMGVVSFVKSVGNAIGGLVEKFNDSAGAEKQLEAVLKSTGYAAGLTKQEILGMAGALSEVTTFEDDTILKGQNLLLTFTKIGKDVFPQATKAMLDVAQAMGGDVKGAAIQLGKVLNDPNGMSAMKRMGVSFSDAQIKMGKELYQTGKIAEYQKMVFAELQKEFGGSARAARETFGGALKALDNAFGDTQETIGSYIAAAGRPFVDNMIDSTKGVTEFLKSESGINKIASILGPVTGILSVAATMAGQFFDIIVKFGSGAIQDIVSSFGDIGGKGNEATVVFSFLGGAVKAVSIGFTIAGKIIKTVIWVIADLIRGISNSVNTLGKFGEALFDPFNPKKWEAVGSAAEATVNSFAQLGKNLFENTKGIIETTINEFSTFGDGSGKIADDLEKKYSGAVAGINNSLNKLKNGFSETNQSIKTDLQDTQDQLAENAENGKSVLDMRMAGELAYSQFLQKQAETNAALEAEQTQKTEDELKKKQELYKSYADTIASYATGMFTALGESLVKAAKGEEDAWKALADTAKDTIARIIEALGQEAIARAALAFASLNIPMGIAWTAAAAAAFTGAGIVRALDKGGTIFPGESVIVGEKGRPEIVTAGSTPLSVTGSRDTQRILNGGYENLADQLQAVELIRLYALIKQAIKDRKILIPKGSITP